MAIYSYDRYTSTGQASFAITFDYLSSDHIDIYLDGVLQTTGYSIDTGTNQVTFTSAPGSGVVVLAQRVTPKTKAGYQAQIADFADGSVLTESDLDNAMLGLLYITQEAEDAGATNALSKDLADNLWDAESIRIKNVDTPTGGADAVTKTYVDGLALYNSPVVPQLYSFTATASQTAFTLSPAPTSTDVQSFIVDLDGVVQKPTTDFTVSGSTLTLTSGASLAQVLTVRNIGIARDILGDSPSTTGDLTVGDDLIVTDDASVGGDLTVTGAVTVTGAIVGNVTSTGSTTARSLATRFADVTNVKDYGATGDGATDDTAAIQAALDAETSITFPAGTYVITSTLTVSSNTSILLAQNATLDFSTAVVGDYLLEVRGTESSQVVLASNTALRDMSVVCVETTFTVGDMVRVASSGIYDAADTASTIGEINFVLSTASNLVNTTMEIQGVYTTGDTAYITKITPVENVTIRGGKIVGKSANDNTQTAIYVQLANRVTLENIIFEQFDGRSVGIIDSVNVTVTGCTVTNSQSASTGYGISFINATQDCIASLNYFNDVRHSLSTNNSASSDGIPRRITFSTNNISDSAPATSGSGGDAIDTHTAAEDIYILDNIVNSSSLQGINAECSSVTIIGNSISNCLGNGIGVHNESDHSGDVLISNNRVEDCSNIGIDVRQGTRGTTSIYRSITLSNNIIINSTSHGISCRSTAVDERNINVIISNNSIYNSDNVTSVLYLQYVHGGVCSGNVIRHSTGNGIRIADCENISATGNTIHMSDAEASTCFYLKGVAKNCVISSNIIFGDSLTGMGIYLDNTATYNNILGNNLRDSAGIRIGTGTGNIQNYNITT